MTLRLRPYAPGDAAPTLAVFQRAVQTTAARDHTPAQLAAWAPADLDLDEWDARRGARQTVVAIDDGRIVGFTDVDDSGYVDMMYVDPAAIRRGVASALLAWAIDQAVAAGADAVRTHASITARPFFETHGFSVDEVRHPVRNGVEFENYAMSRRLDLDARGPDERA
ncbi:GNAT family N-acetyltransferase [Agromyces arachidis]|uniref:GNAT family N-acetyltransferase n=1 Tax=Agromyces arachidis TaxID=766966 RepID=UPI00405764BC